MEFQADFFPGTKNGITRGLTVASANLLFQKIFQPIVTQKHKQLLFQGRGRQQ